jgi:hypothetical protein
MTPRGHGRHEHHEHHERHVHGREHVATKTAAGGSTAESLAGLGAVVLAILGLIGLLPFTLAAIGVIVIGAGLLLRGMAMAARLTDLRRGVYSEGRPHVHSARGGLTIEMLGGIASIALGILALLGVAPALLLSISAIVFGGTLLLSANDTSRIGELEAWQAGVDAHGREVEREAARGAAGTQALVGIGAVVLGILALVGVGPMLTLILISILAVGGAMLLSGALVGTRVAHSAS